MANEENQTYLGDGAYAYFHGHAIELNTFNGVAVLDKIWLEPDALKKLIEFAKERGWKLNG